MTSPPEPPSPERLVTTLLQHALQAARHALAFTHPELRDEDLTPADEPTQLAHELALRLVDLDRLLTRYHDAIAAHWHADHLDETLPF